MTRDDIIKLASAAGIAQHGLGFTCWEGQLERFAALVAAAEREACAKVCEYRAMALDYSGNQYVCDYAALDCARSIRARGNKS